MGAHCEEDVGISRMRGDEGLMWGGQQVLACKSDKITIHAERAKKRNYAYCNKQFLAIWIRGSSPSEGVL